MPYKLKKKKKDRRKDRKDAPKAFAAPCGIINARKNVFFYSQSLIKQHPWMTAEEIFVFF